MKRLIPGFLLAGCWLGLLLSGSFSMFFVVIVILSFLAAREYLQMAAPSIDSPALLLMLCITFMLPVILAAIWHEDGVSGGLFCSVFLIISFVLRSPTGSGDMYQLLGRLIFGAVYVGFLPAHLVLLYHIPEGTSWLIILVAITAGSDSGAYYFGKKFGKRKLCENISPNKTVEGAVGGIASGLMIAALFAALILESVNWLILIPVAVILIVVGIMGDLCESIIKRGTGTKDSGKILLGHGGVLDRVDSLILAAPLLYYMFIFTI